MSQNSVPLRFLLLAVVLCLLATVQWAGAQDRAASAGSEPAASTTQAPVPAPAESNQVLKMIVAGGLPLYIIFALFVWAIWIGCVKCWEFRKTRKEMRDFAGSVVQEANRDEGLRSQAFLGRQIPPEDSEPYVKALIVGAKSEALAAALEQTSKRPASVPALIRFALAKRPHDPDALELALDNKIELDMLPALRRGMSKLATIAKGAPMLGLLGTVWGMIGAFARIASATNVNPNELADNIGFALTTTAAGLIAAIPALIFHAVCQSQIRNHETTLRKVAAQLAEHV